MQRTVDVDAKAAESPTETTLVCGSSCSYAAAVVLAADATVADADAATISAETIPVCGSSCSFAAAEDVDSNFPSLKTPRCISCIGEFFISIHTAKSFKYHFLFLGGSSSHCFL